MSSQKITLFEGIHSSAAEFLNEKGFDLKETSGAMTEDELIKSILENKTEGVGIRSKTQITKKVVESSPHIEAVGAFCIGTNQVDLKACTTNGIPVFNAPYSNTRSVAELVLCEIIALSRKLSHRSALLHKGEWQKQAKGSFEVRGKTLGVVGYGHIGTQVGLLAEALGMRVLYHDVSIKLPLSNAQPSADLTSLLKASDFVTLHVPETEQTKNMIGAAELKEMKKGSYLINASRGSVVDISALASALKEEHLHGAAIDVYPSEPAKNGQGFQSELLGLENVILTPHIGGSTEEAQKNIGEEVSLSLYRFFKFGDTSSAVNFPRIRTPKPKKGAVRITHIHKNQPGVLGDVNSILSDMGINIIYQSLGTQSEIGYLILDFMGSTAVADELLKVLRTKDFTLKARIL
jgi:D-3-phosphoglycerate dehydrogenase